MQPRGALQLPAQRRPGQRVTAVALAVGAHRRGLALQAEVQGRQPGWLEVGVQGHRR